MEYLALDGIIGVVWAAFFVFRKDARQKMLWCGLYYATILSTGFFILRILFPQAPQWEQIVPGYWSPNTLFNLARITNGWSLEDVLYMFFTGGIASVLPDVILRRSISRVDAPVPRPRGGAALIPALAVLLMALLSKTNFIWELIVFLGLGAFIMWRARPDLIVRSLLGGVCYALLYYVLYAALFLQLFPAFIAENYSLQNLSGIFVGQLPLEEMLFALCFGLMWSSVYEYAKNIRQPNGLGTTKLVS